METAFFQIGFLKIQGKAVLVVSLDKIIGTGQLVLGEVEVITAEVVVIGPAQADICELIAFNGIVKTNATCQ